MAQSQALEVREKKEVASREEKTVPARYYVPDTDIYETDDALTVVMEMPGVEKKDVQVSLEDDVLRVEGRIDFTKYEGLEPLYTEYNVGHFARSFSLSASSCASAPSSAGVLPRGRVPLIGHDRTCPFRRLRNSSGLTESTALSGPVRISAPYSAGLIARSR